MLSLILKHVNMKDGLQEYEKIHGPIEETSNPVEISKILTEIENYQKIYDMSFIRPKSPINIQRPKKLPSVYLKRIIPPNKKKILSKRKLPVDKIRKKKNSPNKKRIKMISKSKSRSLSMDKLEKLFKIINIGF